MGNNFLFKMLMIVLLDVYALAAARTVHAADLHVLLVGDTNDKSLGYAFERDITLMQEEVKRIAYATGMELKLSILKDRQTTPEAVLDYLDNLYVDPDDVVVLYFTIHGFRTGEKLNRWPNLFFSNQGSGLDFDLVNELVKEKNPRLLLSIADSCNNFISPDTFIPTISTKNRLPILSENARKNYRNLFLKSSGTIVISSSVPGIYSWAYVYVGGVYTLLFLEKMKMVVNHPGLVEWQTFLDQVSEDVLDATTSTTDQPQIAQYELMLNPV